jgi:methyltransferase (TIGR00027 family)
MFQTSDSALLMEPRTVPAHPRPAASPRTTDKQQQQRPAAWPVYKPLLDTPDAEDVALHAQNTAPELLTERFRRMTPLLDLLHFSVERADPNQTVIRIPLSKAALNQNGTIQGAVTYLLADYTPGVAVLASLPGIALTGLHDPCHALPVQIWLRRSAVDYLAPGTGAIHAEARFSAEDALSVRQQLIEKGRATACASAEIYQGSTLIAKATSEYRLIAQPRPTETPQDPAPGPEAGDSSALLVAGLRDDPVSRRLAGERGLALAARFAARTPQLPSLIRARGRHIARVLTEAPDRFDQVVVLGVGLDPKPLTFSSAKQPWFGVDLPEMLANRARRFQSCGLAAPNFCAVPADLTSPSWTSRLLRSGFDPRASTLCIFEGVSMYLTRDALSAFLDKLSGLMQSEGSRLWIDHVSEHLLEMQEPSVRDFLGSIAALGEPFRFGLRDFARLSDRWACEATVSAAEIAGLAEPVHAEYLFSLLRSRGA